MVCSKQEIEELERKAKRVRQLIIKMTSNAGSGHPGGSLSATELVTCLYFSVMKHNPKNPYWCNRDRFHLSKGHCCPVLYAVLSMSGYFDENEILKLRKFGSILQGHPERITPGVEVSSGSLGQGLSIALGMALAARIDDYGYRIYCLLGDGELQEGNIWEAAMAASHYRCNNLCAIVDYNRFQIDGRTEEVMDLEPLLDKWRAFGWHTIEIDGHNIEQILSAFSEAKYIEFKPTVIIAHTIKGKGVSFMENIKDYHGRVASKAESEIALRELK